MCTQEFAGDFAMLGSSGAYRAGRNKAAAASSAATVMIGGEEREVML